MKKFQPMGVWINEVLLYCLPCSLHTKSYLAGVGWTEGRGWEWEERAFELASRWDSWVKALLGVGVRFLLPDPRRSNFS